MQTWDDRQPIYQQLADILAAQLLDEGLLENRRGMGLFVTRGARERLRAAERERFLHTEWPRLRERLRRLGIGAEQLNWEAR